MSSVGSVREIILNNVVEPFDEFVITLQDLDEILTSRESINAYIGYEPSGPIHLGYFPSIEKAKELSRVGNVNILLADYHAFLNNKGPINLIQELSRTYWVEIFEALGVNKAHFVLGSEYQLSADYIHDLFVLAKNVTTTRAVRSVAMILRSQRNIMVSATIYPLMQVLDIYYLEVNLAFGGTDQRKIHALMRDITNSEIVRELRKKPRRTVCIHLPMVIGLKKGEKMSSSKPETHIAVHDTPNTVRNKLKRAYCPPKLVDPNENPIFSILKYVIMPYADKFIIDRPEKFGGKVVYGDYESLAGDYMRGLIHPLDLKNAVAEWIITKLKPVYRKLEAEPSILKPVYELQKWNYEHGFIDEYSWRQLESAYKEWLHK